MGLRKKHLKKMKQTMPNQRMTEWECGWNSSSPTVSVEEISHPGTSISPDHTVGKWRDLFATNRSSASCSKLIHFSNISTARQCSLIDEDLDSNCDLWKSCVVGYVDGKFPGYKALHDIVTNTWQCEASLTFHESGWLVYKFNSVDDKLAVLASGPYLVYGRPLILKAMPEYFNVSYEEMTSVPVWVKFPNLPLKLWRVTKGTDVAAERKLDPMQTEVDVISQEWETAQGKRKSPGSVDLNTQRSKDIARAPQGWKQRGQEGALDGVKIRSAHKGVATRAFGSGREPSTHPQQ
ncbi:hypothetical protein NC651_028433 [Populus alba x Populus x berolinensis]|nr:hypothetical protein NC651_028433 [Populus alba x Populus x berolinensis]